MINFSFRAPEDENLSSDLLNEGVSPQMSSSKSENFSEFLGVSPNIAKQEVNNPFNKNKSAKVKQHKRFYRIGSKSESSQERRCRTTKTTPFLFNTNDDNLSVQVPNLMVKEVRQASEVVKPRKLKNKAGSLKQEISSLLKEAMKKRKSSGKQLTAVVEHSELLQKNENCDLGRVVTMRDVHES